mmetsp:Transcript_6410/g.16351  ORF Transcript_6410/g.16351 Transcript_6410/m.16351 type:complete len:241 (+) Transcript_6410:137-859(+)
MAAVETCILLPEGRGSSTRHWMAAAAARSLPEGPREAAAAASCPPETNARRVVLAVPRAWGDLPKAAPAEPCLLQQGWQGRLAAAAAASSLLQGSKGCQAVAGAASCQPRWGWQARLEVEAVAPCLPQPPHARRVVPAVPQGREDPPEAALVAPSLRRLPSTPGRADPPDVAPAAAAGADTAAVGADTAAVAPAAADTAADTAAAAGAAPPPPRNSTPTLRTWPGSARAPPTATPPCRPP